MPNIQTASWNHILSVVGRSRKAQPGRVVLSPDGAPAPGTSPWERRWKAIVDGVDVGTVQVSAGGGKVRRDFDVDEPWLEPAREALYRLLLGDPQADP